MAVLLESESRDEVHAGTPAESLRLGFLPLTDAAPLLVADALGLFARHDIRVSLARLTSWAALRDRVAFGRLDGGQMLAPMPLAASLGLGGVAAPLRVVSTLNRHGNTITLSEALIGEIEAAAPDLARRRPMPAAALAAALARRATPPTLAVVFAYSSHNYLLRHWLAEAGIDPDRDVRLCVVPPSQVAGELAAGTIDGFCSGEPWGSRAVDLRVGRIALTTADIWLGHPEKVMAVTAERVAREPERVASLVAALLEAGLWLDAPANLPDAARILQERAMPEVPLELLGLALGRRLVMAPDEPPTAVPGLQFQPDATCPHPEHAAWWLGQMQRWGHVAAPDPALPREIWRPDLWAKGAALAGLPTTPPTPPEAPPTRLGATP